MLIHLDVTGGSLMATCHEYYLSVNAVCKDIINRSFSEENQMIFAESHAFVNDLNEWIEILKSRPELELFKIAFREYQYSLIFAAQGLYRQAFNSLRFFIEHSAAAVYFSFREMDLRLWMIGQQDIYWSNIIDQDNGIFSKNYFKAFSPLLIDEASFFGQIAKQIYRECSEYTHGNYSTHKILPLTFEFNENMFREFHEKVGTSKMLVVFLLCARYLNFLDGESKRCLESNIMEHVGHISGIRESF